MACCHGYTRFVLIMYTVSSTLPHHLTKENAASSGMTINDRSPLLPPLSSLWHSSWSVIAPFTQTLSGLMRLKVGPLALWNFAYAFVCVCMHAYMRVCIQWYVVLYVPHTTVYILHRGLYLAFNYLGLFQPFCCREEITCQ